MFRSCLVGQERAIQFLEKVLDDPPHLFFSGPYGCGKTTLMREFLAAYFTKKGIDRPSAEQILWLSSEQDRGIHCVRQSVAEFVRHSSATPGIYRWIVVDDADSLPIIPQQALRRPMETHAHTTRFIFCSRHGSDLIHPLRSRCMHLELDLISPMILTRHFLDVRGFSNLALSNNAIAVFMSIAQTPTQIRQIMAVLGELYKDRGEYKLKEAELLSHFSAPSFSLCLRLLKAYVTNQKDEMIQIFFDLWVTGISYEDFLHELDSSIYMLGLIQPALSQRIHQLLLRGWMYFAQGKTHSLDMMRLFLDDLKIEV